MKYSEVIPPLPQVHKSFMQYDDEKYLPVLFRKHHITDYSGSSIMLDESLNPDEIVSVTTIKDYSHRVGRDTYVYRAMEETTVPLCVARMLDEIGILYKGGIPGDQKPKRAEKSRWTFSFGGRR